jgi:hypothetical protein
MNHTEKLSNVAEEIKLGQKAAGQVADWRPAPRPVVIVAMSRADFPW